jgi:hypothetical protein
MPTSSLETALRPEAVTLVRGLELPIAAAPKVASRTVLFESLAACATALVVALVLSPGDAGLHRAGPHLTWIAVLILAARYGNKGLYVSLTVSAAMVITAAGVLGKMGALEERLAGSADLGALVAAVLIAWVASSHEKRREELDSKLGAAKGRSFADRKAARGMQDALVALRSRADRMNLSLTFLRNVAERLEGRDPQEAAAAALTLVMTCLQARAGVVMLGVPRLVGSQGGGTPAFVPSRLSCAGPWNGDGSPPTLETDRVVAAALDARRPVNAIDVADAQLGDAEMAVPLLDEDGEPFGALAVRGLPFRAAGGMALRDLAVAGGWLANVLSTPGRLAAAAEMAPPAATDDDRQPSFDLKLTSEYQAQPRRRLAVRA